MPVNTSAGDEEPEEPDISTGSDAADAEPSPGTHITLEELRALAASKAAAAYPAQEVSRYLSEQARSLSRALQRALVLPKIEFPKIPVPKVAVLPNIDLSRLAVSTDDWLVPLLDQIGAVLAGLETVPLRVLRQGGPDNWRELQDAEVAELPMLAEQGIPISWVPRAAVLRDLLAAEPGHPGWTGVVTAHSETILGDCAAALDIVEHGERGELGRYLRAALTTFEAGHHAAAQALAMNVLDTLLRAITPTTGRSNGKGGRGREPGVYTRFAQSIRSMDVEGRALLVPWVIAYRPVLAALQEFWPDRGDDVPTTANRHATAHAVGDIQYTEGNALLALMLSTATLRETHHQDQRMSDPQGTDDEDGRQAR